MKKLVLILIVLSGLSGCSMKEDDTLNFQVEFLPIEHIEVPEYMESGQTYEIKVYYRRPNDCYFYNGFYIEQNQRSQVLAIETLVIQGAKCEPLENENAEIGLYEFTCPMYDVSAAGNSYSFDIYKGEDSEGNMIFETVQIPVGQ